MHLEADFSAASVTINLQTWVLLLDFLGIGTPTPPPSRPASPSPEDPGSRATSSATSSNFFVEQKLPSTPLQSSMMIKELMDQDAEVFYSLAPKQTTAAASLRPSTLAPSDTRGNMRKIPEDEPSPNHKGESASRNVWGDESKIKMKVLVHFRSLDVTFNKTEYPLVKGTVSGLEVSVNVEKGNVAAEGGLALISVVDLTDGAHYYRDRFATTGQQALRFKVFRYGRPDPNMEREWDMSAEVELGSVRYLHTMRFLKEVLAFCMHFPQLIDAFQRMKELARGTLVCVCVLCVLCVLCVCLLVCSTLTDAEDPKIAPSLLLLLFVFYVVTVVVIEWPITGTACMYVQYVLMLLFYCCCCCCYRITRAQLERHELLSKWTQKKPTSSFLVTLRTHTSLLGTSGASQCVTASDTMARKGPSNTDTQTDTQTQQINNQRLDPTVHLRGQDLQEEVCLLPAVLSQDQVQPHLLATNQDRTHRRFQKWIRLIELWSSVRHPFRGRAFWTA